MIVILVVSTPEGNSNGRKMNENRARVLTQLKNGQTLGKRQHHRDKTDGNILMSAVLFMRMATSWRLQKATS